MKAHPENVLVNVLISSAQNRLQLVNIYFNSKIERIEPCLDADVDWQDISDVEKWQLFKEEIAVQQFPPQLKIFDGKFMLLMPGAIDTHVHFNTPGFEHRETFQTGSTAAAQGGVTTVADMPCTSKPPVTSAKNLYLKQKAIEGKSRVDYAFWGGVSGRDFVDRKNVKQQIWELNRAGVIGFKAYFISAMRSFQPLNFHQLSKTAFWLHRIGKPLAVHAEDKIYIGYKESRYKTMDMNDWRAYCDTRDDIAEAKAIVQLIDIAQRTDCWIHIVHLSSALGLEMVRKAQLEGLHFTAETCPHYLYFTQQDFENEAIANFLKTAPPVKNAVDREALWEGLSDGTISFVCTDHAGCNPIKEKSHWSFWEVYSGIPGVEHRVPFLFSEGFKKGRLNLEQTVALLSQNPAAFANLSSKGSLRQGKDADLTLVNLWQDQVIKAEKMSCQGKYTPFEEVTFTACVEATFLRGNLIATRDGKKETDMAIGRFVAT